VTTDRGRRVSNLLLGRNNESEVLEALLAAAREGEGGAMVVHGEPGIGKTALIEEVVSQASEFSVLSATKRRWNSLMRAFRSSSDPR
jgi:Cdc6-like AAA superfamily ATPase